MRTYADFVQQFPLYDKTHNLDELRDREYSRLGRLGQVYLDYTGGGLYADSQVRAHQELLTSSVFGNPHSSNPTSLAATRLIESARASVLKFFNASPEEYVCIFTQNASGALKLVGEAYPFGKGCHYLLTFDNHNSVNGIREYAHVKGADVTYVPLTLPDLRVDEAMLDSYLDRGTGGCAPAPSGGVGDLFAYPAQSNFSSVQHPLEWIEKAHAKGWDVLLDAAAFAPTSRLDLSRWKPDFVPLSFYKVFGYPTGIGALVARR
ncbi:MAG: aminotransferase class V-fold PLP-dependent enzyme, partial [Chloroflexi bacterium]|nr:aminotransferase class V-fold PLP-dependent enzyme [Chloroflexota bacterium]